MVCSSFEAFMDSVYPNVSYSSLELVMIFMMCVNFR